MRTAGPRRNRGSVDGHAHRRDGDAGHRQQPRESRLAGEPVGTAEGGHGRHRRGPLSGDRYEPMPPGGPARPSHRPWVDGRTERSMVVWRSSAIASIATSPRSRPRSPSPSAPHRSARDRTGGRPRAGRARGWAGTARTPRSVDAATASVGACVTPCQRGLEPEHAADEHGDEHRRDHRPRDGPADDVVDRVQPVAEHGDRHRDRDPRHETPNRIDRRRQAGVHGRPP